MCQYDERCNVHHHRTPEACPYWRRRQVQHDEQPRRVAAGATVGSAQLLKSAWMKLRELQREIRARNARRVHRNALRRVAERREADEEFLLRGADASARMAVDALFADGFPYEAVASGLVTRLGVRCRFHRKHWLCVALSQCADACDPGTYIALGSQALADELEKRLQPRFLARALAGAVGEAATNAAKLALPSAHLATLLRVLIVCECPDLEHCPTEGEAAKALVSQMTISAVRQTA